MYFAGVTLASNLRDFENNFQAAVPKSGKKLCLRILLFCNILWQTL